ncbi:hypothetical protein BDP27DRAFT_352993 [Rhodocollybia butyracea]|uniref:Uncharacterized protein n=1 Tax=Rhodocollybia butyracea TaxID=206335 RepID=A0A9P5UBF7_9AGAR|nr:hypothetical protein BDP27DRAFT_352993 [Rhodocollybia butyracea]
MRWFGPPTRREISLFLFCSTVFTFAYNLENTLRFVGFDAPVAQAGILSRLGYVSTSILYDGRKSLEWRDDLDDKILGNAEWNDGEVLDARLDGQSLGVGPHSAMWISKQLQDELWLLQMNLAFHLVSGAGMTRYPPLHYYNTP